MTGVVVAPFGARLARALAATRAAPGAEAWWRLGQEALGAGDFALATDAFDQAVTSMPDARGAWLEAGRAAYLDNRLDVALARLGRLDPRIPAVAEPLALTHMALGRIDEARSVVRQAASPAGVGVTALRLKLEPGSDVVRALEAAAEGSVRPDDRRVAAFALAGWHDAAGRPEQAATWARRGNAVARANAEPYDRRREEAAADQALAVFDALAETPLADAQGPRPLVIVGMPRSGTSLVESMVAASPDVTAGGERTEFALIGRELEDRARGQGPAAAAAWLNDAGSGLRSMLAGRLERAGIADRAFTDKLPANTLNVGAVAALCPDARFLHVRRDPRETALSIWLLDFAAAYPYASDPGDIAHALSLSDRLMTAWSARLPGRILTVDHAALCADPATEGDRIARHCGLDWSADLLAPERRDAPMRTFSALQVRGPIRAPSPRWPLYAPHLRAEDGWDALT